MSKFKFPQVQFFPTSKVNRIFRDSWLQFSLTSTIRFPWAQFSPTSKVLDVKFPWPQSLKRHQNNLPRCQWSQFSLTWCQSALTSKLPVPIFPDVKCSPGFGETTSLFHSRITNLFQHQIFPDVKNQIVKSSKLPDVIFPVVKVKIP